MVDRLYNDKDEKAKKRNELAQKYEKEAKQLYNFKPTISNKSKMLGEKRNSNASSNYRKSMDSGS